MIANCQKGVFIADNFGYGFAAVSLTNLIINNCTIPLADPTKYKYNAFINGSYFQNFIREGTAVANGLVGVPIGFSPQINLTESPGGTWHVAAPGAAAFNVAKGLSPHRLPAGINGRIYADVNGAAKTVETVFQFTLSNSNSGYAGATNGAGFYISGAGNLFYVENTVFTAVGAAPANALLSINRVGTTLAFQSSTDGGTTWVTIHTFTTFVSAADLYIICDLNGSGTGFLVNPKGDNIDN